MSIITSPVPALLRGAHDCPLNAWPVAGLPARSADAGCRSCLCGVTSATMPHSGGWSREGGSPLSWHCPLHPKANVPAQRLLPDLASFCSRMAVILQLGDVTPKH